MSRELPDRARELLDAPNVVTVATINPDGSPQTSVLWATYDGDDLLLSTIESRAKHRNLSRDPRISVLIHDHSTASGSYVEVRGAVSMTRDGGPELIERLSQIYDGQRFAGDDGTDRVRVVIRVTPTHVVVY